jgi:hypothetical protein
MSEQAKRCPVCGRFIPSGQVSCRDGRDCWLIWLLLPREANEIKRTLANIPAGIAKPTAAAVATLELGEFYACWGRHAVPTYVQPAWMTGETARLIAMGEHCRDDDVVVAERRQFQLQQRSKEDEVNAAEAQANKDYNDRLVRENDALRAKNLDL